MVPGDHLLAPTGLMREAGVKELKPMRTLKPFAPPSSTCKTMTGNASGWKFDRNYFTAV